MRRNQAHLHALYSWPTRSKYPCLCSAPAHPPAQCTWPEGVPTRKKATPRKESVDGRPSTAESSGLSETSTPPTRDSTPPRRSQAEYSLPPVVTRRHRYTYVPFSIASIYLFFAVSHIRHRWARILNSPVGNCECYC